MALPEEEEKQPEIKADTKKKESPKKEIRYPSKPKKPLELLDRSKFQFRWIHLWIFFIFLAAAACVYLMISFVMLAITPLDKLTGDSGSSEGTQESSAPPADWCNGGTTKNSGTVEIRIKGIEEKDGQQVCKKETYSGGALVSKVWENADASYRYSESYDIKTGDLTGSSLIEGTCTFIYDDTGEVISEEC